MKKLILVLVLISTNAWARPQYYGQLLRAYPGAKIDNTFKCQTCHGNGRFNAYGMDFASKVRGNLPLNFALIDKLDSDGDGVPNGEEIMRGTNPGVKGK